MKSISEYSEEYGHMVSNGTGVIEYRYIAEKAFEDGFELSQRWISIEDELPETTIEEEGILYSEYLNIKVKGYNHPLVGYYVKADDDEFFDVIFNSIQKEIKQSDITHWRPIEFK